MKITEKQANVLENLHRIKIQIGTRKTLYLLDGEDCRRQLVSLSVKKIIVWAGSGRPSQIADPDGFLRSRWIFAKRGQGWASPLLSLSSDR